MSALATLRREGFFLRLVEGERIGIIPIERVGDERRTWIERHRDELLDELRVEAANEMPPVRDPSRWNRFVVAAVALGVTEAELSRHFPHEEDREDIRLTTDAYIEPCACTIARAVLNERTSVSVSHGLPAARQAVQCAECLYFVRSAVTHGYGACAVGVSSTGATVLHFATHRHPCNTFENTL